MKSLLKYIKTNFSFVLIISFWAFALLNPVFKKYDYGAGLPLLALFSFLLLGVALVEFWRNRERAWLEKWLLLIFSIFYAISYYYSSTKNISFPETVAYLLIPAFYLFFAYQKINWGKKAIRAIAVIGFVAVVFGFVQFFLMEPQRMVGPFFNILYHANFWPNAFGLFLLLLWPTYLIVFKDKWKWSSILVLSMVISAILLSFSRGAFIAFCGQIVLFGAYYFRRINKKTIIFAAVVAAISFGIFYGANYVRGISYITIDVEERVQFANDEALTSSQERVDFWKGSYELAKQKPLFGWGPFSFRYAYNPMQKTFLGNSDHPHNIFLKFASENGFVAMSAFILFLISILVTVFHRFKRLDAETQDVVAILSVAVIGAFAHSLIDYNFNFVANLLLLFIFLAIIRSSVVEVFDRKRPAIYASLLVLLVFFAMLIEGGLMIRPYVDFLKMADSAPAEVFYPRYKYLDKADALLQTKDYDESLVNIDQHLALNSLDSQAYYLRGAIYCSTDFESYDLDVCIENFKKAYELNPMNDVNYYRDYFRALERKGLTMNDLEFADLFNKSVELFHLYFGYVKNNVHFTAYTPQVESAAEMADLLMPYLDKEKASGMNFKKIMMLQYAKEHRGGKTF